MNQVVSLKLTEVVSVGNVQSVLPFGQSGELPTTFLVLAVCVWPRTILRYAIELVYFMRVKLNSSG